MQKIARTCASCMTSNVVGALCLPPSGNCLQTMVSSSDLVEDGFEG